MSYHLKINNFWAENSIYCSYFNDDDVTKTNVLLTKDFYSLPKEGLQFPSLGNLKLSWQWQYLLKNPIVKVLVSHFSSLVDNGCYLRTEFVTSFTIVQYVFTRYILKYVLFILKTWVCTFRYLKEHRCLGKICLLELSLQVS